MLIRGAKSLISMSEMMSRLMPNLDQEEAGKRNNPKTGHLGGPVDIGGRFWAG